MRAVIHLGAAAVLVRWRMGDGAILAMASTPSFDPTPLASHSEQVQRKTYNDLVGASPSPILDRTIGAVYPPGSTFKLVVSAAALQHGYTPTTAVTGAPRAASWAVFPPGAAQGSAMRAPVTSPGRRAGRAAAAS